MYDVSIYVVYVFLFTIQIMDTIFLWHVYTAALWLGEHITYLFLAVFKQIYREIQGKIDLIELRDSTATTTYSVVSGK